MANRLLIAYIWCFLPVTRSWIFKGFFNGVKKVFCGTGKKTSSKKRKTKKPPATRTVQDSTTVVQRITRYALQSLGDALVKEKGDTEDAGKQLADKFINSNRNDMSRLRVMEQRAWLEHAKTLFEKENPLRQHLWKGFSTEINSRYSLSLTQKSDVMQSLKSETTSSLRRLGETVCETDGYASQQLTKVEFWVDASRVRKSTVSMHKCVDPDDENTYVVDNINGDQYAIEPYVVCGDVYGGSVQWSLDFDSSDSYAAIEQCALNSDFVYNEYSFDGANNCSSILFGAVVLDDVAYESAVANIDNITTCVTRRAYDGSVQYPTCPDDSTFAKGLHECINLVYGDGSFYDTEKMLSCGVHMSSGVACSYDIRGQNSNAIQALEPFTSAVSAATPPESADHRSCDLSYVNAVSTTGVFVMASMLFALMVGYTFPALYGNAPYKRVRVV